MRLLLQGGCAEEALDIINGVKVDANALIAKGELTEETIKIITEGHIKAFDWGIL